MQYRILIVGENAATRNTLAKTLIAERAQLPHTYQIITVGSAAAAQLQATRQKFHLLLMAISPHSYAFLDLAVRLRDLYPLMSMLVMHDGAFSQPQLGVLQTLNVELLPAEAHPDHLRSTVGQMLGIQATASVPAVPAAPAAPAAPTVLVAPPPRPCAQTRASEVGVILKELLRRGRAHLAIYMDNLGNIIAQIGDDTNIDIPALSSLVAGSFVNAHEMGRVLRDMDAIHLNVYEGKHYDVYSANVGRSGLVSLFFDKQYADPKLGFVWLLMKRSAEVLTQLGQHDQPDEGLDQRFHESLSNEFDRLFGDELTSTTAHPTAAPIKMH